MLKKTVTLLAFIVLTTLFFGCDILDPEKDEKSDVIITTLVGNWVEQGETPTEIIQFDGQQIIIYSYGVDSTIDTTDATFILSADEKQLNITDSDGLKEQLQCTITATSITITFGSQKIITYIKYDGVIPHISWIPKGSIEEDSGSVVNGVPTGAWKSSTAVVNEILLFKSATLLIKLEYDPIDSVIIRDSIKYSLTEDNSGFIVEIEDGKIDTVFYVIKDGVLTVTPPDGLEQSFVPFSGDKTPEHWIEKSDEQIIDTVIVVDTGSYKDGIPLGSWAIDEAVMDEMIVILPDTLILYEYDYADSSLSTQYMKYTINSAKTQFIFDGEDFVVDYSYNSDTKKLTIITPGESETELDTIVFVPYNGTKTPSDWVIREFWNEGLYDGQWLSGDSTFLLSIHEDSLFNASYDFSTGKSEFNSSAFKLSANEDTIFVINDHESYSIIVKEFTGDKLIIISPDNETVELHRFDGDIDDIWDIKHWEGGRLNGQWILDNGEYNSVWYVYSDTIDMLKYNEMDSTVMHEWHNFTYVDTARTLYIHYETHQSQYSVNQTEDTLKLTSTSETLVFFRDSTFDPKYDWDMKNDSGHHEEQKVEPFFGQWMSNNGNEVFAIGPKMISIFKYIDQTGTLELIQHPYQLSEDTLYTITSSGTSSDFFIFNATEQNLEIKNQNGIGFTLTRYDGMIPLANWNVKNNSHSHITDNKYLGNWATTRTPLDEIVLFRPTLIQILEFDYTDKRLRVEFHDYYIDATGEYLVILDGKDDMEMKMPIIREGEKIEITELNEDGTEAKTMSFSLYSGSIPPSDWDFVKQE